MTKYYLSLLFSFLVTSCLLASNTDRMCQIDISQNWEFSQAHKNEWRPATVPGTVHQDLINHNLLPNPFWGLNEEKIQWVENYDWEYRTSFILTDKDLAHSGAMLFLEGLDTYADVYLNGTLLFKADNMFVGYKEEVRNILREGENLLYIYFHSPINHVIPQWAARGFDYPADNDHHSQKLSVFTRKAPYSYGWDWGIRMVTSGVWRPISLTLYDIARIDDMYVEQREISKESADLNLNLEINSLVDVEDVRLELLYGIGTNLEILIQNLDLKKGLNKKQIPINIVNPELWMPNGWGDPNLYDFGINLSNPDGDVFATKQVRTGLRTIRLIHEEDQNGRSFFFEVNGEPMFAKGANYIPDDALLPNISVDRYQNLFRDIKDANMNMIRIWGGGTYENDVFYQLADENGILIWQDFMFACTTYPHDSLFLKKVKEEATYNIKRLRNYASVALWCGNNEILEGIKYWGWDKRFSPAVYSDMKEGYEILFNQLLPEVVSDLDPLRSYVHSSPYSANWGRPESWKYGDSHNWGIWYGRKPFESLDTELSRFMSEFGFQSFPEMKTISTFAEPKDYQLESDVMNGHQKSSVGNELVEASMKRYYNVPERFEDFVYVGLVLQGQGMKHGFEAHRRNKPYCMGTLYWQLNDSWPVVSWSSIDYYGNWKAMHYQAKRAFAPLALNTIQEGENVNVYLLSDELRDYENLVLDYEIIDFHGKKLKKGSFHNLSVKSNSSTQLVSKNLTEWLSGLDKNKVFLNLKLKQKKGILVEDHYFFDVTKNLELPEAKVTTQIKKTTEGIELTLKSKTLAKDVFIEIPIQGVRFTDNFFDLLPGEKKIVSLSLEGRSKEIQNTEVKINHIKNTY